MAEWIVQQLCRKETRALFLLHSLVLVSHLMLILVGFAMAHFDVIILVFFCQFLACDAPIGWPHCLVGQIFTS
jgi:hypothetical protein